MSNFQLKLIALITMTIDHIGYILVDPTSPYYLPLRTVGRLSFVIFAFLISEGVIHTKNKERYIANLFLFAFIIDIPRQFFGFSYPTNIFYTLGLGALAIYLIHHFKNSILKIVSVLAMVFFASQLNVDYGEFGVLLIISINVSKTFTNDVRVVRELMMAVSYYVLMVLFNQPDVQMYGIYAFLIILLYNGERGYYHPKLKYLLYIYYPLHLMILSAIGLYT